MLVTPFSKSADEVFLTDEYSNYSGNPITLKEFLDPFKEVGGGHIYENDIFTVNDGYYCTLSSSLNEDKTLCPRVYKTDKHYEFSFSYSKEYLQMIDYLGAYLGIILDGNVASYSLTSQSYHYFFERCGFFYALSLTENLNYDVYYNDLTIYLINKDPNFNKKCLKNMSEYNGKCGSIHRFDIEKTREYIDKNNLYF